MKIEFNFKQFLGQLFGRVKGLGVLLFVYILLAVAIMLTVKVIDEVLPAHEEYVESQMELVEEEVVDVKL